MNTETDDPDDTFYDPFQIDHLRERVAALENLFKHDDDARLRIMDLNHFEERIAALETKHKDLDMWVKESFVPKRWTENVEALEDRIAALEKHLQETEVLLLSASTSRTELHKRIATLEAVVSANDATIGKLLKLRTELAIADERIAALEDKIK